MNRQLQRILAVQYLGAEVSRFIADVLDELAAQGVFDAPGVIGGVLGAMRHADSAEIRSAAVRTEFVLCQLLMPQAPTRLGRIGA